MKIPFRIKWFLFMTAIAMVILIPETLVWLLQSFVIAMFEALEAILDEIVMHVFHTDRHTTQIIVFN